MLASKLRTGALVMAVGAALLGHVAVAAAQQPNSLVELLNSIPKSPATLEEADKLVDWKGESSGATIWGSRGGLVAMPALKAGLDAHEAAVNKIVEAANAKIDARVGIPTTSERAAKGVAAAGIDMDRMQKDPAYAKEMQAKMKAMSPAELMAMSMAMQEGMGATEAEEAVDDPPTVKAAADAGKAILDHALEGPKRAMNEQRWAEVEKKTAAITAKYQAKMPPPDVQRFAAACDTQPNCGAAKVEYASTAMPLVIARETEILKVETAAFEEERTAVAAEVRKAEEMLKAAQYGALSQEFGNPLRIAALDADAADKIRSLAGMLEQIAKRAGHVGRCKSDPLAFFYQISACYGAN